MTPDEMQRVLRAEAEHQKAIEVVRTGRGFAAVTAIVVIGFVIYLLLHGIP